MIHKNNCFRLVSSECLTCFLRGLQTFLLWDWIYVKMVKGSDWEIFSWGLKFVRTIWREKKEKIEIKKSVNEWKYKCKNSKQKDQAVKSTPWQHTHTHTHTHIYIYIKQKILPLGDTYIWRWAVKFIWWCHIYWWCLFLPLWSKHYNIYMRGVDRKVDYVEK